MGNEKFETVPGSMMGGSLVEDRKIDQGRRDREVWEYVEEYTDRLRVPGGWLYRDTKHGPVMAFVPES